MCGRFTLTSPLEALRELFGFPESPNLRPRVNIAPTQEVVTLRRLGQGQTDARGGEAEESHDEGLHLAQLRWGLVPSWAKDISIGAKMINARSETVAEKPAFRQAFARRRCLIPADGFYEWKTIAGAKQPFRIVLPGRGLFAFAGLWESWCDRQSGETVESCTILTTDAADSIKRIHHRMPVIFTQQAQFAAWTDPRAEKAGLLALLRPLQDLEAYPVSKAVNRVANDDLSLLEPVELPEISEEMGRGGKAPKNKAQGSLF